MEGTGIVWKSRESGGIHRPELDGSERKQTEHPRNYCIVQGPGSANPYSYPCRHIRASDLWCRRRRDVSHAVDVATIHYLLVVILSKAAFKRGGFNWANVGIRLGVLFHSSVLLFVS